MNHHVEDQKHERMEMVLSDDVNCFSHTQTNLLRMRGWPKVASAGTSSEPASKHTVAKRLGGVEIRCARTIR